MDYSNLGLCLAVSVNKTKCHSLKLCFIKDRKSKFNSLSDYVVCIHIPTYLKK